MLLVADVLIYLRAKAHRIPLRHGESLPSTATWKKQVIIVSILPTRIFIWCLIPLLCSYILFLQPGIYNIITYLISSCQGTDWGDDFK